LQEDINPIEAEYSTMWCYDIHKDLMWICDGVDFSTYEEALEDGLKEALEML